MSDTGTSVESKSPFDDDDEEDENDNDTKPTITNGSRVSVSLPTLPPDEEEITKSSSTSSSSATTIESRNDDTTTASDITTTLSPSENEVTTLLWPFGQQLGKTFEVMTLRNSPLQVAETPRIQDCDGSVISIVFVCLLLTREVLEKKRIGKSIDRPNLEGS